MDYNQIKDNNSFQDSKNSLINNKISNPIDTSRIMPLNTRTSSNRLYGGWSKNLTKVSDINYLEIINAINEAILNQTDIVQLFYSIHKQVCLNLNLDFLAVGVFNHTSNYINIKLVEKTGSSYNSKILLSDEDNVIIKAFKTKEAIFTTDSSYLKMNYISETPTTVIPLVVFGECLGVIIYSDNNNQLFDFWWIDNFSIDWHLCFVYNSF